MSDKILVVDDDEEICQEMSDLLVDSGYKVRIENDGLDLDKILAKEDFNLLLLDLKLPGISGYDILKKVKKNFDKLKVLVISGRPMSSEMSKKEILVTPEEERKEQDMLKVADGFLNKPFLIEDLLSKIKELLKV